MLEIFIIGFILALFGVDDLVVDGINQLFNTSYTVSVYWVILFFIGILVVILVVILNNFNKEDSNNKDKKSKKNKKKSVYKIKKLIKAEEKKAKLSYLAIKYEYKFLIDGVDRALIETKLYDKELIQGNTVYAFKLDEYFRKMKVIRDVNVASIEGIACLCKAIAENSIFEDTDLNERIFFEIIRQFYNPICLSDLKFNNKSIRGKSKEELIMKCFDDYLKYNEDIFLMCAFVLDRFTVI